MIGNETNEIVEELFRSLLDIYQEGLEESMGGSEFPFCNFDLLYYKLHKISLNRTGSNIDSSQWLENKKATINPKDKDDKCFQYAATAALDYRNIKSNPEVISKINPFIDQYNWKEIDFSSHKKDWRKFELNNKSTALNIFYEPHNTEEIRHACVKS